VDIKLEKLRVPSVPKIESLAHGELIQLAKELRERLIIYEGLIFRSKEREFGKSSERGSGEAQKPELESEANNLSQGEQDPPKNPPKARSNTKKKPSERYPNAAIREEFIGFTEQPCCPECGGGMPDSGMTEDSEYLTCEPKEYVIVRQKRRKHRCQKCHSTIATAPAPDRVIPGGTYSDELIIDSALSKYLDLIPMERYCQMAARSGVEGLPPNSLIAASMKLSQFLYPVYERIRLETLDTQLLLADETTHRMLEGDEKSNWYLWNFSNEKSCFFECHNTRSGDVSTAVLEQSRCEFLLTDVYSGYGKSIRLTNKKRAEKGLPSIKEVYCNAHARRQFKERDSKNICEDADFMVRKYAEIYKLNKEAKGSLPEVTMKKRTEMRPIFEKMKAEAKQKINSYSSKSQMYKAYNYFLKNYAGLTRFLDHHFIPIDNNQSERIVRSPVIGRKTWYGNHSKKAAESSAIHFTIVESCKLVGINPREFYKDAVQRIHQKREILTPFEYMKLISINTA
jgi:transposase